jgi:F-box and WD-40 domain protein 1/11
MDPPTPRPGWLAEEGLDDHESGIGIALTSSEIEAFVPTDEVDSDVDVGVVSGDDENDIVKLDFVSELPAELAIQVLGQLDAATLATASRVSKNWHEVIKNQHIWRESFLQEKTGTYATSARVKPGTGLGVPAVKPGNDWKEIYRVKEELDKRWREGKARAVYLNGHSDSIYCLQFDEYVVSPFVCSRMIKKANYPFSTNKVEDHQWLSRQDNTRLGYAHVCLQARDRPPGSGERFSVPVL